MSSENINPKNALYWIGLSNAGSLAYVGVQPHTYQILSMQVPLMMRTTAQVDGSAMMASSAIALFGAYAANIIKKLKKH